VQVQLLASLTAHTYLTHRASGITSGNDYATEADGYRQIMHSSQPSFTHGASQKQLKHTPFQSKSKASFKNQPIFMDP